jgi:hypothetical protein
MRKAMSEVITGFVKEVTQKSGQGRNGKPYTLYGVVVVSKEGRDLGRFGAGFDAPACKKDDYVQFSVTTTADGKYYNIEGPIKVSQQKREPPAAAAAALSAPSTAEQKEATQKAIQYQAARNAAIEVVKILGSAKALPITGAATKAGEAKRYDEILAIVDKLTVRFNFDTETLRVLDTVQDEGTVETPAQTGDEAAAEGDGTPDEDFVDDDIPF